jgi:excinuclease UvrABC helicase subunit UvrB
MKGAAEDILNSAISAIEAMREIDTPAFQFERVRSLNYLKATLKQIRNKKDSPLETLKTQLSDAVEEEDYEKAAVIRDRLRQMEEDVPASAPEEPDPDGEE